MECGAFIADEQEPLLSLLCQGNGDDDLQTWVDALFDVDNENQGSGASAVSCASDPSQKRARRPVGGDREFTSAATQNPPQLCADADTQSGMPDSGETLPRPCTGEHADCALAMSVLGRPLSPFLTSLQTRIPHVCVRVCVCVRSLPQAADPVRPQGALVQPVRPARQDLHPPRAEAARSAEAARPEATTTALSAACRRLWDGLTRIEPLGRIL